MNESHFVLSNAFLKCCNPRLLNKTELIIQKYKRRDVIHTLLTPNSQN